MKRLVQSILAGEIPKDIAGIAYRDEKKEVRTLPDMSCHEIIDWRDIPYDLIDDYRVYGQLDHENIIFSIFSAMGCAYNCAFCSSPALYRQITGKRWQPLPVNDVVDHVAYLIERYNADYIYFIDDDSFVDIRNVGEIIDAIRERGLDVKLGFRGARINELMQMDHEYLSKLADAGTDILHIGAESGSNRLLSLVKKNCTVDDILEVNRKLAAHPEIALFYNFIIGLPTETVDDLKATAKLWLQLIEDHPRCIIGIPNMFRPLPGTELFDLAQTEWGYHTPASLEEFAEIEVEGEQPTPWFTKEHRDFCDLMLICSYFIDDKVNKVTAGKSLFFAIVGVASKLYAPIARFRLKHGVTAFFIERPIFRLANRLMGRRKRVGANKAESS